MENFNEIVLPESPQMRILPQNRWNRKRKETASAGKSCLLKMEKITLLQDLWI